MIRAFIERLIIAEARHKAAKKPPAERDRILSVLNALEGK